MHHKLIDFIYNVLLDAMRGAYFAEDADGGGGARQARFSEPFRAAWLNGLNSVTGGRFEQLTAHNNIFYAFPKGFLEEIAEAWKWPEEKVLQKRVAPLVSPLENVLIGETLTQVFGQEPSVLGNMNCLRRRKSGNFEFIYTTRDFPRGLVVPQFKGDKLITDLRLYRSARDRNSFCIEEYFNLKKAA
jgi:hypothetical protein